MPMFLFKFPILVVAEILTSMTYREIFLVSLASRRTKNLIKSSMFHARCSISMSIDKACDFKSGTIDVNTTEQDPQNSDMVTYKIGSTSYKVAIQPNNISVYWTQPSAKVDCVKDLITHIAEVFNRPTVYYFEMKDRGAGEPGLGIFKHANSAFRSIERVVVDHADISPEVFVEMLKELRNLKTLILDTHLPDDFEYSPDTPDYFKFNHFFFRSKIHWVKLDDYMECRNIELCFNVGTSKYYTPANLNGFIRKWINANCRLETLDVLFPFNIHFDFPAVVEGFGEIQQERDEQFVEIEGANGKKAKISKRDRMFTMKVKK